MQTTVIGSYPKPDYINLPDWFKTCDQNHDTIKTNKLIKDGSVSEEMILKSIEEVIMEQKKLGIDIITDGEMRRENYIYYFCRDIEGINFDILTEKTLRNGAYKEKCPTIINKLTLNNYNDEWIKSNNIAKKHDMELKYTIPGPMTICDTITNTYYQSEIDLCKDLSIIIRKQILYLKENGCKHIQIDEPVFARYPDKALEYGIDILNSIIQDIDDIFFTVHICCGYPTHLDDNNYQKSSVNSYDLLADKLDKSLIDAISIEDGHCHLDLSFLKKIKNKKIVFGVIAIAKSKIETIEEIIKRIDTALEFIPMERLIIAPDCGLAFLPKDILLKKINSMVCACNSYKIEK